MNQRRTFGLSIARSVTGITISMMAHFAVAAPACRSIFNTTSFSHVQLDQALTEIAKLKFAADEAMTLGGLSTQSRLLISTSKVKINELTDQLKEQMSAEEIREAVSTKIRSLQQHTENVKTAENRIREETHHLTIDKRGEPLLELKSIPLPNTQSEIIRYLDSSNEVLVQSKDALTLVNTETGESRSIQTEQVIESALADNKTWISIKKDGTVTQVHLDNLKEKKLYRLGHRYWTLTKTRYDEYHISTQGTYILAKNWKDYFVFDRKTGKKLFKITDNDNYFIKFIDDTLIYFCGNNESYIIDVQTRQKYPIEMPFIYFQTIKKLSNGLFQVYDGENVYFIQPQDILNFDKSKRIHAFTIDSLSNQFMGRADAKYWEFGFYPDRNLIFASVGNGSVRIHDFYDMDSFNESVFIAPRNPDNQWITAPHFHDDKMYFIEQTDSSALKIWGHQ